MRGVEASNQREEYRFKAGVKGWEKKAMPFPTRSEKSIVRPICFVGLNGRIESVHLSRVEVRPAESSTLSLQKPSFPFLCKITLFLVEKVSAVG